MRQAWICTIEEFSFADKSRPVSDRLVGDHPQQFQPFDLAGNPGQLNHLRHQRSCPPTGPSTRRITASANRVGVTHAFFDQEVVEQPIRHKTLLQGGVRQPVPESNATTLAPRRLGRLVNSRTNSATWARVALSGSIPSRSQTCRYSASPRPIRIDGSRRTPQICPDPQPLQRPLVPAKHGPLRHQRFRDTAATSPTG
jgi:hypothetical protein